MDKKEFDFDFDFEKEFGLDPKDLEGVEFDPESGPDLLGFDLNDPIFDEEEPQTAKLEPEAAPVEPVQEAIPPVDDYALEGFDLDSMDFGSEETRELRFDESGAEGGQNSLYDDMTPADSEEIPTAMEELDPDGDEPVTPPPARPETPRERRQRIRKFKEDQLPRIIAMVAAGFILFFILGSVIRGIVNNIADKKAQAGADASSQSAAQLLDAEAQKLLDEAAALAAGYDYEGAIAKLDSFSGELSAYSEMVSNRSAYSQANSQLVAWSDPSKIPNLSFHVLIADPSRAFNNASLGKKYNQNFVTTDEFSKILQQLYENGYVLVSMSDIFSESTADNGITSYSANTIYLPSGKKPIMITETLVNYLSYMIDSDNDGVADKGGAGFASRLVLDGSGNVKAEMVNSAGETVVGDYDLVPILNSFIEEHPDFSYKGARALLSICGYEGVFGYRTQKSVINTKGQDYYDEQVAGAKAIVEALRADGYELACYTWENIAYGNRDATQIKTDLTKWTEEVKPIVGDVDILVYAQTSDINDYTGSKYNVLYSSGFRYFINNSSSPWAEISTNYVRQSRLMVTGTNMAYYSNMFSSYFDSASILNSARGTVPN